MSPSRCCMLILLLFLSGCGLEHPYPTKSLYVLPPADLEPLPTSQSITLKVPRASVSPPFNSRAFQYRVGDDLYEPAYYAQWAADPGSLFSAAVSRSIASTGAFIVLPEAARGNAATLHLNVIDLYADVRDPEATHAVVTICATLIDRDGNVILVRETSSRLPTSSEDPQEVIDTWAKSVTDAISSLIPELQTTLREGRP